MTHKTVIDTILNIIHKKQFNHLGMIKKNIYFLQTSPEHLIITGKSESATWPPDADKKYKPISRVKNQCFLKR